MKKLITALMAAAMLLTVETSAFAADTDVSVFSRHSWRGQAGDSVISIQPTVGIPVDTNIGTTSVELWSQIPLSRGESEIDLTISQSVLDIGTVNVTSYYYNGPYLDGDSHDLEVGISGTYAGVDLFLGRFIHGDDVKDDTWVELGYVTDGDGFAPVLAGVSFGSDNGYTATFQYNIDSETPLLIVSKSW